jgi:proline dehydrogenase
MDSIDAVEGMTGGTGFAAIKITALGRPKLLLNISEVLVKSKSHYNKQAQAALNKIKVKFFYLLN